VRSILGYIDVAEPEHALSFFKLALVFEILSAKIFSLMKIVQPQLDSSDELFTETEEIGSDDMSDITAEWQSQVKRFTQC